MLLKFENSGLGFSFGDFFNISVPWSFSKVQYFGISICGTQFGILYAQIEDFVMA